VISCLSGSYSTLFKYEGSQTDKHVRAHELYSVTHGISDVRSLSYDGSLDVTLPGRSGPLAAPGSAARALKSPYAIGGVIAAVLLAGAASVRMNRPAPVQTPGADVAPVQSPKPPAPAERPVPEISPTVTFAEPKPEAKESREAADKAKAPAPQPGILGFAVSPWGEVYVNGVKRGVSPPLQELALPAGRYTVELRNAEFPPHVQTITIAAGARARVQYKFQH
jgi:hypothetical protein